MRTIQIVCIKYRPSPIASKPKSLTFKKKNETFAKQNEISQPKQRSYALVKKIPPTSVNQQLALQLADEIMKQIQK